MVQLRSYLLPMLAGALAAVGQAPLNWGVPMLLGMMAAYALLRRAGPEASAFGIGWRFGAGYFAVALHWIVEPFLVDPAATAWMAPFALVFMVSGLALFWGAGFWLAGRLRRGPLAFAAALTVTELARAYLFTGFPWAMPSYAWVGSPVALLAAWIGPHGVNFVLFASASLMVHVLLARRMWPYRLALGLMVVALIAPVPRAVLPEGGPVVRLIQPNAPQDQKWLPEMQDMFFQRQLELSAMPGAPDYVIWPETAIVPPYPFAGEEFEAMSDAAGDAQIITGLRRVDGPLFFNSLIVLDSDGNATHGYDKHHLVPFGEYMPLGNWLAGLGVRGLAAEDGAGFAAGAGPELLQLDGLGAVLPLICYEVVFPQDLRTAARPDLLLQITNDAWFGEFSGPYQHLAQARMRSIELGLPMIRVANTGVSAVIDPWGNVLAQIPLGQAGYLDSTLPPARAPTLYAQTGDWPLLAFLVAILAVVTLRRPQNTIDASGARN